MFVQVLGSLLVFSGFVLVICLIFNEEATALINAVKGNR